MVGDLVYWGTFGIGLLVSSLLAWNTTPGMHIAIWGGGVVALGGWFWILAIAFLDEELWRVIVPIFALFFALFSFDRYGRASGVFVTGLILLTLGLVKRAG